MFENQPAVSSLGTATGKAVQSDVLRLWGGGATAMALNFGSIGDIREVFFAETGRMIQQPGAFVPQYRQRLMAAIPLMNLALASADVHFYQSIQGLTPPGYTRITEAAKLALVNLKPQDITVEADGYDAALYANGPVGGAGTHYIFASRGTDFHQSGDIHTDIIQRLGLGASGTHYAHAIPAALRIYAATQGRVSFTGISLGGGLASAQAVVTGGQAMVLNAAEIFAETVRPYMTPPPAGPVLAKAAQHIHGFRLKGEMLSFTEANIGAIEWLTNVKPPHWENGHLVPGAVTTLFEFVTGGPTMAFQWHQIHWVFYALYNKLMGDKSH